MNSEAWRRRRWPQLVVTAGILAAALSAGCANQQPGVRVAPENLDFNYAVQGAPSGALRAMNDGAQTMLVLREPLPAQLTLVPVKVQGQLLRAAVHGNTILVPGVPRAFSVLLPAGLVNVVHGGAGVDQPDGMPSTPAAEPAMPTPEGTTVQEPDTNWDWGDGEAGHAAARPRVTWGLPTAPQNARVRIEDGPLPGSLPAGVPDGMDTN